MKMDSLSSSSSLCQKRLRDSQTLARHALRYARHAFLAPANGIATPIIRPFRVPSHTRFGCWHAVRTWASRAAFEKMGRFASHADATHPMAVFPFDTPVSALIEADPRILKRRVSPNKSPACSSSSSFTTSPYPKPP